MIYNTSLTLSSGTYIASGSTVFGVDFIFSSLENKYESFQRKKKEEPFATPLNRELYYFVYIDNVRIQGFFPFNVNPFFKNYFNFGLQGDKL